MATETTGGGEQPRKQEQEGKGAQAKQAGGKTQRERGAERDTERGGLARREPLLPSIFGGWGGSPFTLMRRMMEDMDRVFGEFGLRGLGGELAPTRMRGWSPQVDVFEREGKLVVRADLPGVSKEDVHVEVTDDTLVLDGERREEREEEEGGFYRSERSYGSFRRVLPLPEGVDPDKVEARFENGVLEISMELPKEKTTRGKKIEIQQGKGESLH